jgi:protein-tyrosine-phosphatase/predicted ATP-grasp superfamily ATP-dependent carboligase
LLGHAFAGVSAVRVLILDGHSPAAVEAAQSLGRRGAEIDLACETRDCLAFASRYVANRLAQPASVPSGEALAWLERRHEERRYDVIVPSTDVALALIRELDESHPVREKAVLPCNRSLDIALDKLATHEMARSLGIPVPRAVDIERNGPIPECEQFPVVLKSRHSRVVIEGANRRLEAVIAMDAAERERVLAYWLPNTAVQQQEFVPGRGFGIETLFDRGRALWYFAHERIHEMPLTGGGSSYRRSIAAPPALLEMALRLLRELAWHGVAMVEFRGDGTECNYLMEINPRLWGSLALPIDCGLDFPAGLAALAKGEAVAPQPSYRIGYFTRALNHDVQWHKKNLRADHANPLLLTRPRSVSVLELFRPLYGRESWDHFDWSDLGVTSKMLRELFEWETVRLSARVAKWRSRRRAVRHHEQVKARIAREGRPGHILFLCYGNICRSPIAARLAERELNGARIGSAGFHRVEGRNAPGHICRAAAALGLDLFPHRSRLVNETDAEQADLVLCMDLDNLELVQRELPGALARTTLLALFAQPPALEIEDPYFLSERETQRVIGAIQAAIRGLRAWLDTLAPRRAQLRAGERVTVNR